MHDMLSSDILQVLIAVEGRYIQWEWDPQTLQNDYITLREADGHLVVRHDKSGREFSLRVARGVIQTLIGGRSVYEDESKRASALQFPKGIRSGIAAWLHSRGYLWKISAVDLPKRASVLNPF